MPPKQAVMPRRARGAFLEPRILAVAALLFLGGCHGGTLDIIDPGQLGHTPPPAVNLPPQDAGMERL